MANNDQNDKELNNYLNGDSELSKAYRASNKVEPSSHLDERILSAAKESVENTNQKEKIRFHKSPWVKPVSIAALVTLSVSLVVTMQQETGQPLISEPEVEMYDSTSFIEDKKIVEESLSSNEAVVESKAELRQDEVERAEAAPEALGAASDFYREEEIIKSPKVRMKEAPAKKKLLKEKVQIQTDALEERTFADEQIMIKAPNTIESDSMMDIRQTEQTAEVTQKVDLVSEIKKLIATGENSLFIHVGESTKNKLITRKNILNTCSIIAESGDVPIGDGKATDVIYIYCPIEKDLGLRLREENNRYHILDFWTLP